MLEMAKLLTELELTRLKHNVNNAPHIEGIVFSLIAGSSDPDKSGLFLEVCKNVAETLKEEGGKTTNEY